MNQSPFDDHAELEEIERCVRDLRPELDVHTRDRLMFQAGQASHPKQPAGSGLFWKAAAVLFFFTTVGLAFSARNNDDHPSQLEKLVEKNELDVSPGFDLVNLDDRAQQRHENRILCAADRSIDFALDDSSVQQSLDDDPNTSPTTLETLRKEFFN